MKALTVWQPWASLIAIGAKPYEFRGWRPPASIIGQRIAIHAGARPVRQREAARLWGQCCGTIKPHPCIHATPEVLGMLDDILNGEVTLPLSHVVCTAIVGEPRRGDEIAREFGENAGNDSDREGTFTWGWPMLDVQMLTPPVPARGAQGLWEWSGA